MPRITGARQVALAIALCLALPLAQVLTLSAALPVPPSSDFPATSGIEEAEGTPVRAATEPVPELALL